MKYSMAVDFLRCSVHKCLLQSLFALYFDFRS
uniref:Uncharacterized protein n=1 Tax=Siphoviridae sp. ct96x5 TaxID=2825367 RepID=A0A8S5PST2_9CAUD|nr:MAG TPA: hypothetical protein [Siphoviridae sp. ct96x5]